MIVPPDVSISMDLAASVTCSFLSCGLVPAALEVCPSPPAEPAPASGGDSHLPWKGGVGSPPPCLSLEATKIIPVDLQQAWNQSISSLESVSSPPAPPEAVHPRVSALSRLGGPRPVSYTPPGSVVGSTTSIAAQAAQSSFCFPEKRKKTNLEEEDEEEEMGGGASQEMQPLMSPSKTPGALPPPPPPPPPSSGRRRNPCVYLRSLVAAPPPGSTEPHSRGPTQL